MNGRLLLQTVATRLWRFKLRTLFMGIGITIGVLATVVLQSVSMTITQRFMKFFQEAFPANSIVLFSGGGPMAGPANRDRLRDADVQTVVSALGVTDWDPILVTRRDVKAGANSTRVTIEGHSERAESVRHLSLNKGEFFTADDVTSRANVAILGPTAAKTLFGEGDANGAQLFIDDVPFRIGGVLAARGLDVHGRDLDDVIFVPYTTLQDKLMKVDYVSVVTLLLDDASRVPAAKREIEQIMRERHGIAEGQEDDFTVMTTETVMQMFKRSFGTVKLFVPLIAATAFLISALVILTIMQLTIRSRIAEIGLRKAVGARERDLRLQLFLEVASVAVLASLAGLALVRVGLSALMPMLTQRMGVQEVHVPMTLVLVAVAAAIATGVIGALLPARRAARLDPVQALR